MLVMATPRGDADRASRGNNTCLSTGMIFTGKHFACSTARVPIGVQSAALRCPHAKQERNSCAQPSTTMQVAATLTRKDMTAPSQHAHVSMHTTTVASTACAHRRKASNSQPRKKTPACPRQYHQLEALPILLAGPALVLYAPHNKLMAGHSPSTQH